MAATNKWRWWHWNDRCDDAAMDTTTEMAIET